MSDPGAWVSRMEWIFGIVRLSVRPPATSAAVTLPNEMKPARDRSPLARTRAGTRTASARNMGRLMAYSSLLPKHDGGFHHRSTNVAQPATNVAHPARRSQGIQHSTRSWRHKERAPQREGTTMMLPDGRITGATPLALHRVA